MFSRRADHFFSVRIELLFDLKNRKPDKKDFSATIYFPNSKLELTIQLDNIINRVQVL